MPRRLLLVALLFLTGCVYLNTLYNGEQAWARGERARLAGRSGEAVLEYRRALEKAEASLRRDSTGGWVAASHLLAGQARFRLGEPGAALSELEDALARTEDPDLRRRAHLYRGAALFQMGRLGLATEALNLALFDARTDELRGEAHLWRGRVLLARGLHDQAWWDLEQAVAATDRLRLPTHLETLTWAVAAGDTARARRSAEGLYRDPAGAAWADSILVLAELSREVSGPLATARILAGAGSASWPSDAAGALRIRRAGLFLDAGLPGAADRALAAAADEGGAGALAARRELARLRLARARSPGDLGAVREVLLPVAADSGVAARLTELRAVALLAGDGSFPALFVAAEVARDDLEAPELARTLFLQAAHLPSAGPWRGKALLAARTLPPAPPRDGGTAAPPGDAGLFTELLRSGDPYVARARNRYLATDTLVALDRTLEVLLDRARARALDEAGRRDPDARSTGTEA